MHPLQVGLAALGRLLGGFDAGARDDVRAQVGHQLGKVPVAGGAGDFHVELEVAGHRVGLVVDGGRKAVQGRSHGGQLIGRGALGGQAGGLGFQADAQLQHRDHIVQRGHVLLGNAKVLGPAVVKHKSADAVAGLHLP